MTSKKSLLLGSAAALLLTGAAQAADLPIPEPVEYVKVCDTYGVGFWYIPGTDTCIRIGGYVRAQAYVHESNIGEDNWGGNPFVIDSDRDLRRDFDGDGIFDDRLGNDFQNDTFNLYVRGLVNFDARTETEYGTLRSFVQIRGNAVDQDNPGVQLDLAFLQFAGFTGGLAPSFLDFATNGFFGDQVGDWNHDTTLFGYTQQLGGGLSFNIAIESGDRADTTAADVTWRDLDDFDEVEEEDIFLRNTFYGGDETRTELPDLTAAFRVNQGWGEAMLGGVVRQVKGRSETSHFVADYDDDGERFFRLDDVSEDSHDEIGWAIVGGLKVNLPMLAQGDHFILRGGYSEGAARYVSNGFSLSGDRVPQDLQGTTFDPAGQFPPFGRSIGSSSGMPEATFKGNVRDGWVDFDTAPVWSVYAGFTHYWRENIRSNFTASYAGGDFGVSDSDWSAYTVSANVIWSPVKNLDVGLEVIYAGRDYDEDVAAALSDNPDSDGSDDAFGAIFRIQRNFGN